MKLLLGSLLFAGVCWLGAAIDFTAMPNFNTQQVRAGNPGRKFFSPQL